MFPLGRGISNLTCPNTHICPHPHCPPRERSTFFRVTVVPNLSPSRTPVLAPGLEPISKSTALHPTPAPQARLPAPPGRCPSCPDHLTPAFHRPQTQSALTTQFGFYRCAAETLQSLPSAPGINSNPQHTWLHGSLASQPPPIPRGSPHPRSPTPAQDLLPDLPSGPCTGSLLRLNPGPGRHTAPLSPPRSHSPARKAFPAGGTSLVHSVINVG